MFCNYVSIKSPELLLLLQSAGKADMMSDSMTTIDVSEFDSAASKSNHFPTTMNLCFTILSLRNIFPLPKRFLMSPCELSLLFHRLRCELGVRWGP